jgi:hypothetical protein
MRKSSERLSEAVHWRPTKGEASRRFQTAAFRAAGGNLEQRLLEEIEALEHGPGNLNNW